MAGPWTSKASNKPKASNKTRSSGSQIPAILRVLKLQLFRHFTHVAQRTEPRNTAIYKSRTAAFLHTLLHLLPVAGVITIVAFNLGSTFVWAVPTNVLTALQFAAKLLEILIQGSIAAIVLAIVRHLALGTNGLPFGGLIAPYRTQDVSSLWSLEFWGCLTAPSLNLQTKMLLSLVLTTAVILASVVGPSSAILMIPRPVQHLIWKQLGLMGPVKDLYPRAIMLEPNGTIRAEYMFNQSSYQAANGLYTTWPAPIVDSSGLRGVQLVSDPAYSRYSGFLATVPTVLSITQVPGAGGDGQAAHLTQPYVHTDCWSSSYPDTEIADPNHQYIDFGPNKAYLKDTINFSMVIPNYTKPANNSSIAVHQIPPSNSTVGRSYVWSKLPPSHSNGSLVMVVSWPDQDYTLNWTNPTNITSQLACTIDAYWATATTNATTNAIHYNDLPASSTDGATATLARLKDKTLTSLSPEWAKRVVTSAEELMTIDADTYPLFTSFLAFQLQTSQYALAMSYIPPWGGFASSFGRNYTSSQEETGLNGQQYDAIENYISSRKLTDLYDEVKVYYMYDSNTWTDPETLAQAQWTYYESGYGYNTSPITVKLSLAVVMVYLVLAVAYLICTVVTGYTATSWDSVAELVALALNSERPKTLGNTSVGIDTLETFRKPVSIRVNQEDSLEVVFKDGAGKLFQDAAGKATYTTVAANKKYC